MIPVIETTMPNPPAESAAALIPPRHWWLRRIAAGSLIILLCLVILRCWWGVVAGARLAAEISRHQAAGQPVLPGDFVPAEPQSSLPADLLREAAAGISLTPQQLLEMRELRFDLNLVAERVEVARAIVEANRASLALVRRARAATDRGTDLAHLGPMSAAALGQLAEQVSLNHLIGVAAALAHFSGDEVEAVEWMHDHNAQSSIIARSPSLLSEAMPSGSRPYALGPMEVLAPRLAIAVLEPEGSGEIRAAERSRIDALIRSLLEEESIRQGLSAFIYQERAAELEFITAFASGRAATPTAGAVARQSQPTLWQRAKRFPLRPMYELDAVELLRYCSETARASAAPNWNAYLRQRPPDPIEYEGALRQFTRRVSSGRAPSFARSVRAMFRVIASRRMAATALALRLYEADHERRPTRLEDLTPEYLPEPPLDPFGSEGRLLGYQPEGELPVLYSVGPDGRDDAGRPSDWRRRSRGDESGDIPFYLNGRRPDPRRPRRPESQPSTQAGGDNQDVEDGNRKRDQSQDSQSKP